MPTVKWKRLKVTTTTVSMDRRLPGLYGFSVVLWIISLFLAGCQSNRTTSVPSVVPWPEWDAHTVAPSPHQRLGVLDWVDVAEGLAVIRLDPLIPSPEIGDWWVARNPEDLQPSALLRITFIRQNKHIGALIEEGLPQKGHSVLPADPPLLEQTRSLLARYR